MTVTATGAASNGVLDKKPTFEQATTVNGILTKQLRDHYSVSPKVGPDGLMKEIEKSESEDFEKFISKTGRVREVAHQVYTPQMKSALERVQAILLAAYKVKGVANHKDADMKCKNMTIDSGDTKEDLIFSMMDKILKKFLRLEDEDLETPVRRWDAVCTKVKEDIEEYKKTFSKDGIFQFSAEEIEDNYVNYMEMVLNAEFKKIKDIVGGLPKEVKR